MPNQSETATSLARKSPEFAEHQLASLAAFVSRPKEWIDPERVQDLIEGVKPAIESFLAGSDPLVFPPIFDDLNELSACLRGLAEKLQLIPSEKIRFRSIGHAGKYLESIKLCVEQYQTDSARTDEKGQRSAALWRTWMEVSARSFLEEIKEAGIQP